MKRILSINIGNIGSTGNIVRGISEIATKKGYETYFAYPMRNKTTNLKKNDIVICNSFYADVVEKLDSYIGIHNCMSFFNTIKLLIKIKKIAPDIIHLHNIHSGYVNVPMLFKFIKKENIKVIWTLHDCWSFTGRCPHFLMSGCNKWKEGCFDCDFPSDSYPAAKFDHTNIMWKMKKKLFTDIKYMILVTPSNWLAALVKESFLKEKEIRVVNNGINLKIFKPTKSSFREKYSISNKNVILGVSFGWGYRKGLDIFIELSKIIDSNWSIVLVGVDKQLSSTLPSNIIAVEKTQNQTQLAEIYSMADIFFNPTREDTFPTVNMEALACGTPVLTFDTGGSPEIIDNKCGAVISSNNNIELIKNEIENIVQKKRYRKEDCISRAKQFDQNMKFAEYVTIYNHFININEENS